ncbi:1-(5-phosphoribosyl)-5-[(5-phosphoribosylamino)methylideneamino]imidazole-4-carboxamide isomerase [Luteibaculum oceani]|uniref:1-(5-phosphoribosyl)-5-[(5-phosphoribosylamino)methylideneamino] imidazole-4-carboxamide isomerase n=1 Tax=Luteibaculum oceani TaxID=1294296 RepID=A0A5C6V8U5_9FLAO|nr:1-(5-phosphoribosyl)-5-[(5-phosphoribosylamino)methylideneamino]imidazole-4-carboxamide isomerase [Luteibaculum oceani]TXC81477.1 1-(5-phosphoribosyl)-5-[(5-phosphoribosylamino)methylideneamino]imidazole-4-carboxamide isomerase [Luteibaculum oceani]
MEIIPAIDLIDGKCVRLTQGDYQQKVVYNENPLEQAKYFEGIGIKRLHLVDLDGAKAGQVQNLKVLEGICSKTELEVDFSGGISGTPWCNAVFDAGAKYMAIGSVAVKNPSLLEEWISEFGADKIILAADVKNEKVAVSGWEESSDLNIFSFLKYWLDKGIVQTFVTDISKDGMLAGPAFELYQSLLERFPKLHLIASGGVSNASDLQKLKKANLSGAIVGKAIYEGRISELELKSLV